jgi:MFS family permease
VSLSWGFLPIWFLQNGFQYREIIIYFLIRAAVPSVILFFRQQFTTAKNLILAFGADILLMLIVFRFFGHFQIYLAAVFSGVTVVYFYMIYNVLFFENTPKDKRATSSGIYNLAAPIIGIVIPVIAGYISAKFGFAYLFLSSIVVIFGCLVMIRILPKISFQSDLKSILPRNEVIRVPLILEGVKESVPLTAIAVFTLIYIKQPIPYGIFLSYLAIVAVVAALLMGLLSDRLKKRTLFLYPAVILTGISIILLGFSRDLNSWAIFSGIFSFTSTIASSFLTTMVLDKSSSVQEGMINQEFLKGIGRLTGSFICLIPLLIGQTPQTAMILIGLVYLSLPFIVNRKKVYNNFTVV